MDLVDQKSYFIYEILTRTFLKQSLANIMNADSANSINMMNK